MKPLRTLLSWIAFAWAAWAQPAAGPGTQWRVYMKVSPCAENRMTDWITVADRDPTPNGPNHYIPFPQIFQGQPAVHPTFASAMATATAVKTAACTFGTGETPGCPKYQTYCCHKYQVFQNTQTQAFTVVPNAYDKPGYGPWLFVRAQLCCEDAFELAGMSPVCGGGGQTYPPVTQDTAMTGTTLTFFSRSNVGQCQADCANNANCKGFTFIQAGTYKASDPPMCYLLSAVTGRTSARGHSSGMKGGGPIPEGPPPGPPATGVVDLSGTWTYQYSVNADFQMVLRPAGANTWEGTVSLQTNTTGSFADDLRRTRTGPVTVVDAGEGPGQTPGGFKKRTLRITFRPRAPDWNTRNATGYLYSYPQQGPNGPVAIGCDCTTFPTFIRR